MAPLPTLISPATVSTAVLTALKIEPGVTVTLPAMVTGPFLMMQTPLVTSPG